MTKRKARAERARQIAKLRKRWPLDNVDTRVENGLQLLRAIATHHGGQFDGDHYLGTRERHHFTCRAGHHFTLVARHLLGGSWCGACDREGRRTGIVSAEMTARLFGGACLSTTYLQARGPLRWRCREGHEWDASLRDVRDNEEWCPTCRRSAREAFDRGVLCRLIESARAHDGFVVSPAYLGTRTKLRFLCAAGHEWETLPDSILKKGTWCPLCRMNWRSPKDQLVRLRQVIRTQGGTLLSKTYVNRATKVTVRCREGHVWDVQPAKLHQGRWCPTCHYARLRTYTTQKRKRRPPSSLMRT